MATMFTGLARVARKTGFPVDEAPGWEKAGHGGMHSCSTIVIHHTAGSNNGKDYNSYGTVKNGRPGLPGPLAQLGVGRNTGTVYVFAAGRSWHAGKVAKTAHNNDNAIGIEIENNGIGEKYSANAYSSAVALAGELVKEFGLSVNDVLGHKEIAIPRGRKIDPSFGMDKFRDDVRDYIKGGKIDVEPVAVVKPKPASKPAPKPAAKPAPKPRPATAKAWPHANLLVDGDFGKLTVKALQELLKGIDLYTGYIDGDFGKMTKTATQKWLKAVGHYSGRIDGDFGPISVRGLQSFLVAKGELPNKAYIDGRWGNVSAKALQRYINAQAKHYR